MLHEPKVLLPEQFLLVTLMVKLAIVAVLATMLVRFPWFRRILLTEKRDWPERLVFAASLGVPLTVGVLARLLLNYEAADLTLSGSFLVGLMAGPYAGAIVGAMAGTPAILAGEWIALPFAIGCGFAGGGLREICPKEAIWHFSPLFFTDLHRYVWRFVRRLQIDWIVLLLAAPISLELLRQWLGHRFGTIYYPSLYHAVTIGAESAASHTPPTAWLLGLVVFATVLAVAIPIKIWNSARIEHRLQEQEKLLLAARIAALASQINPHFLFNTLTSISSLIRSQPETARMVVHRLSALLRRRLRDPNHFVSLREELDAVDEYLDIEQIRFGPQLRVQKQIDQRALDVLVPSMILQPLVENCIKHGLSRKVGGGTVTLRVERLADAAAVEVVDDGLGMSEERLETAFNDGIGLSNVSERLRVIYGARSTLRLSSVIGWPRAAQAFSRMMLSMMFATSSQRSVIDSSSS